MNKNNNNGSDSSKDNSLVFRTDSEVMNLPTDQKNHSSSGKSKKHLSKHQREVFVLSDDMFDSNIQNDHHSSHHGNLHTHKQHSSFVLDEKNPNSDFTATNTIKKSEIPLKPIVSTEPHIKKSKPEISSQNLQKVKPDKTSSILFREKNKVIEVADLAKVFSENANKANEIELQQGEKSKNLSNEDNSTLVIRDGKKIINLIDTATADIESTHKNKFSPLRFITKKWYKYKAQRARVVKSDKRISIEQFFVRILEIWSILILSNFIVFFFKPITDKIINKIFGTFLTSELLLSVRYLVVWILITVICVKPIYNIGYKETKSVAKIKYYRIIPIFFLAEFMYVALTIFFMDLINPAPLLGALAVNGVYIAAFITGARNLLQLVEPQYKLLNILSIISTLQFAIIPLFFVFRKGAADRIYYRNLANSPHKKSTKRKVFIINEKD